jgi:cell division septal protein FtsQ
VTVPTQHRANPHRTEEDGVCDVRVDDDPVGEDDHLEDDRVGEDPVEADHLEDDRVGEDPVEADHLEDDRVGEDRVEDDRVSAGRVAEPDVSDVRVGEGRARVRPMIDPRIRERRIEVLRAAGRRRLRVTLVIASAIVVVGLGYLVVRSPLLAVDHIRVTGSGREPRSKIMNAAGIHAGQSMVFLDAGAAQRRIERLQWIAHARVQREFPDTVNIDVTEYVPSAYVRIAGGKIALIASTGRVIALSHEVPPHAVAVVGEHITPVVGSTLNPPQAADIVSQLPVHLRAQVLAIDVGGATAVIDLRAGAPASSACRPAAGSVAGFEQLRLGTLDSLQDKGVAALAVLNQLAGRPFSYIDVSVPQAPVSC